MKNTITLLTLLMFIFGFGQEKRDTLFIQFDNNLLQRRQHPLDGYYYYTIIDNDKKEDITFFIEKKKIDNKIQTDKLCSLQEVLEASNAYTKDGRLEDWRLLKYFCDINCKKIILVKSNENYEVRIMHEIE